MQPSDVPSLPPGFSHLRTTGSLASLSELSLSHHEGYLLLEDTVDGTGLFSPVPRRLIINSMMVEPAKHRGGPHRVYPEWIWLQPEHASAPSQFSLAQDAAEQALTLDTSALLGEAAWKRATTSTEVWPTRVRSIRWLEQVLYATGNPVVPSAPLLSPASCAWHMQHKRARKSSRSSAAAFRSSADAHLSVFLSE